MADMLRLGIGTLGAEATLARGSCENEWRVWLASRRAALEDAAKVCEARFMGDLNREDQEARRCAAAIRALADEGVKP